MDGMVVEMSRVPGLTDPEVLKQPLLLQCPPTEPFTVNYGYNDTEWQTVYDGAYSRSGGAKLIAVSFKTLFVEEDFNFVLIPSYDIETARHDLRQLSRGGGTVSSGQVFNLLCSHPWKLAPEISMTATLPEYTHEENEPGAYYATLAFKEWRDPSVSSNTHNRVGSKTWPKHHTIAVGDTLYSLATKYYGKASEARTIAHANHITQTDFKYEIHKIGGKWKVGATISIPAPAGAGTNPAAQAFRPNPTVRT